MADIENVPVPFREKDNARYLTRHQIEDDPCLAEFVELFKHCFRVDPVIDVVWFEPPDNLNVYTQAESR